ncbi:lysylphosphatidylglycerol synthase domain-containing protein [Rhizobiaceae bacterium BDR2-2]|uniref:Lysylphosphatidylglycerol synthase domain-containing protein n=1 Tax=Ectorhizobium quercum TaxID=2965071 RepID=A0AAE3SW50_9HYPH|nr:lysylphosphatidylglycerol synthase domain-containing protein [Ectorhizobium quercum]MCX8999005.1 lysylphosphatidylglycerol synthase domain-containing protein [Ectorhizobium quercum]
MAVKKYLWPVVGLATIGFSVWLLYHELRGISFADLKEGFAAIPLSGWLLSGASTLLAYAALAGYDHIALLHLKRKVHWLFITLCSFTTYALSHNVGASVVSGAVVRYRAYVSRGLSAAEIGVLVALCSGTFALGVIFLAGLILVFEPDILARFSEVLPMEFSTVTGVALLTIVALYVAGSFLKLRPLKIGPLSIVYPSPPIVARQLVIGPLELIGAAGIIYFALPEAGNPGFVVVLGIFLVSFSAALISHAPGGLGVLELVFVMGLPDMDPADVVVALLVFRLFYLIIPFIGALFVILFFERSQFTAKPTAAAGIVKTGRPIPRP